MHSNPIPRSFGKQFGRKGGRLLLALALLLAAWPLHSTSAAPTGKPPYAAKELIFVSDGMRPDLAQKYATAGDMPNYAKIFNNGVTGDNGMVPQFPPNTGAGWTTISTGAWSGTHGGDEQHLPHYSNAITTSTSRLRRHHPCRPRPMAKSPRRRARRSPIFDWTATLPGTKIKGPAVDYRNFYSSRGVIANYEVPGACPTSCAIRPGLHQRPANRRRQRLDRRAHIRSARPKKRASASTPTSSAAPPRPLTWPVYIYDSTDDGQVNYDHALIARGQQGRRARLAGDLKVGDWKDDQAGPAAERPARRLLPEADGPQPRSVEVPGLFHLAGAGAQQYARPGAEDRHRLSQRHRLRLRARWKPGSLTPGPTSSRE